MDEQPAKRSKAKGKAKAKAIAPPNASSGGGEQQALTFLCEQCDESPECFTDGGRALVVPRMPGFTTSAAQSALADVRRFRPTQRVSTRPLDDACALLYGTLDQPLIVLYVRLFCPIKDLLNRFYHPILQLADGTLDAGLTAALPKLGKTIIVHRGTIAPPTLPCLDPTTGVATPLMAVLISQLLAKGYAVALICRNDFDHCARQLSISGGGPGSRSLAKISQFCDPGCEADQWHADTAHAKTLDALLQQLRALSKKPLQIAHAAVISLHPSAHIGASGTVVSFTAEHGKLATAMLKIDKDAVSLNAAHCGHTAKVLLDGAGGRSVAPAHNLVAGMGTLIERFTGNAPDLARLFLSVFGPQLCEYVHPKRANGASLVASLSKLKASRSLTLPTVEDFFAGSKPQELCKNAVFAVGRTSNPVAGGLNLQIYRRHVAQQHGIDPELNGISLGILPALLLEYLEAWTESSRRGGWPEFRCPTLLESLTIGPYDCEREEHISLFACPEGCLGVCDCPGAEHHNGVLQWLAMEAHRLQSSGGALYPRPRPRPAHAPRSHGLLRLHPASALHRAPTHRTSRHTTPRPCRPPWLWVADRGS